MGVSEHSPFCASAEALSVRFPLFPATDFCDSLLGLFDQRVQAFTRQLADFVQISVLDQQRQFTFLRRLINYDTWRIAGRPQSTQFLDYQVVNSTIEAERDHLRVGDHFVRVLTMKEAITETRPLVLDSLLKIPANFMVCTEWRNRCWIGRACIHSLDGLR